MGLCNAAAQSPLPRLHVRSLSLRADTAHPQIEKPFHLIISAHFKETIAAVDFVVLPNLAELEDLGDERHTTAGKSGTDFTETITVLAHHTGRIHVDPVYFNAIDARDGKPKTFSSNDLVLAIEGGALENPLAGLRHVAVTLITMLAIVLGVVLVASYFFRRRARTLAATAPAVQTIVLPAPVPVRSPAEIIRESLNALRANPSRRKVLDVRRALWAMAGAGEGETLADVLERLHGASTALDPLLRRTERAAFIQDAYVHGAIDDMILALEQYLA